MIALGCCSDNINVCEGCLVSNHVFIVANVSFVPGRDGIMNQELKNNIGAFFSYIMVG